MEARLTPGTAARGQGAAGAARTRGTAPARRCTSAAAAAAAPRIPAPLPRPHVRRGTVVVRASSPLQALADLLLNRAASTLERGQTTCLTCRGTGSCTCPACRGRGTLPEGAAAGRMNPVRHAAQKLKGLLREDGGEYSTDWLVTNRCRRCHGNGGWQCDSCNGSGLRAVGGGPLISGRGETGAAKRASKQ
ncbi:hypothetical protein Rsub_04478 [Raphidocelis subcapitata]|uniref:Uncharacterized protein n=1 Tax=Raphidocelis subcapitata TaxID=307507 RepID=A0A2V0NWX8_9CHLO|nr:hypothetical protein Rsub_04478 [Raphidocelis subcapitata]|eukprot:GBF92131.1 hypothetical protein Rsub_04478 [Raphidocelis subcapitata]